MRVTVLALLFACASAIGLGKGTTSWCRMTDPNDRSISVVVEDREHSCRSKDKDYMFQPCSINPGYQCPSKLCDRWVGGYTLIYDLLKVVMISEGGGALVIFQERKSNATVQFTIKSGTNEWGFNDACDTVNYESVPPELPSESRAPFSLSHWKDTKCQGPPSNLEIFRPQCIAVKDQSYIVTSGTMISQLVYNNTVCEGPWIHGEIYYDNQCHSNGTSSTIIAKYKSLSYKVNPSDLIRETYGYSTCDATSFEKTVITYGAGCGRLPDTGNFCTDENIWNVTRYYKQTCGTGTKSYYPPENESVASVVMVGLITIVMMFI